MKSKSVTDGFEIDASSPLVREHRGIGDLLAHFVPGGLPFIFELKVEKVAAGRAILASDRHGQIRYVTALVERLATLEEGINAFCRRHNITFCIYLAAKQPDLIEPHVILAQMLRSLLRRKLQLPEPVVVSLLEWLCSAKGLDDLHYPLSGPIQALEVFSAKQAPSPTLRALIRKLAGRISRDLDQLDGRKYVTRLRRLQDATPVAAVRSPDRRPAAGLPAPTSTAQVGDRPEAKQAARSIVARIEELERRGPGDGTSIDETAVTRLLAGSTPETKVEFIRLTTEKLARFREELGVPRGALGRYLNLYGEKSYPRGSVRPAKMVFRRGLPFAESDLHHLVERLGHLGVVTVHTVPFVENLVSELERFAARSPLRPETVQAIGSLAKALQWISNAPERKLSQRLKALAASGRSKVAPAASRWPLPGWLLQPGESWSDAVLEDLGRTRDSQQRAWAELLWLCHGLNSAGPSRLWTGSAKVCLKSLGFSAFKKGILAWFPLVDKPNTSAIRNWSRDGEPDPNQLIIDPHARILKGLALCCGLQEDPELARALTALALSCYRRIPKRGPRLVGIGNACVTALGMMPGMEGVGQLALLKVKVRFGTAQKVIEKALEATAKRVGLPREDLEEMAVPAYGLTGVGVCEEVIGEFTARLTVAGDGSTELVWLKPDARPQKSVPAAVRTSHAEELKELQVAAKDILRMLPAQRERLDGLFVAQRSWPLAVWRERYLNHPLVGVLARRLIWEFIADGRTTAGMFQSRSSQRSEAHPERRKAECGSAKRSVRPGIPAAADGELVDLDLRPVRLNESTVVRLWHPIGKDVDEVLAWRGWLESQQIRQPFKQAHREVYVLTDAERGTRTYSNRFAAHILRQHQFNALCAARGWRNKLRLMVDAEYPPASRMLPQWGLRAEFCIEGVGDTPGTDTAESGAFLRVATDQVRFYQVREPGSQTRNEATELLPLDRVPPLAFSEIMRDVDLFVGVASVGNDPTWNDGGPEGRFRDYWQSYSFGDLPATARTRKAILERLVPRLKIADRCSFADKFLVVRGQLRSYKIHLGSGNILMTPNDQYLCIVRAPSTGAGKGDVFLPFEGDGLLSVILSKAFLLAEDDRIQDASIVSQLRRRKNQ